MKRTFTLSTILTVVAFATAQAGTIQSAMMSIEGDDDKGNPVSAKITIELGDIDSEGDTQDLKISIENTSSDSSVITAWGLETPGSDPVSFQPPVVISGTGDDSDWDFETPISGNGQTTNGVGPFGTYDFGMTTGNQLNSGSPNSGIGPGAIGMFLFEDFDASVVISDPKEFFMANNGDNQSMGLRYQRTGPSGDDSAKIGKPTIPEPSAICILLLGLAGLLARRQVA